MVVLTAAGCGGGSKSGSTSTTTSSTASGATAGAVSASDKTSGVTVSVAGDKVTVRRTATSTAGTGGAAGQVACTNNYKRLATASAEPAPSEPWYAATLITWPATGGVTTATLSHALASDPDLCIAETSASQTQVVVYFRPEVKSGVAMLQQASQATAALGAAAQTAVGAESKGAFPAASVLLAAMTAQGLYDKQVPTLKAVTDTGTIYLITGETTKTQVVLAIKAKGVVHTATQGLKGSPKLGTAKSG